VVRNRRQAAGALTNATTCPPLSRTLSPRDAAGSATEQAGNHRAELGGDVALRGLWQEGGTHKSNEQRQTLAESFFEQVIPWNKATDPVNLVAPCP
jgi:hypothetical protein